MATDGGFQNTKDAISSALVETIRVAGQISNEDLAFHRASNPSIAPLLDRQSGRLLNLAHGLLKAATRGTKVFVPPFANVESVDENWSALEDVLDNLLEKADACLDEFTGSIKRLSPGQEEQIKKAVPAHRKQRSVKDYGNQVKQKPQHFFNDVPRNDEKDPFKPLLRIKPHAMVNLEESLDIVDLHDGSKQYDSQCFFLFSRDAPLHPKVFIDILQRYKHPYETEIKAARYPTSTYVKADPIPYLSFDDTEAVFVDTPEAVAAMLAELSEAKEIAIDLEHHDEHSYAGIVSLMQISTRTKDWIVDTLKPWRRDLQVLNEIFTDPNILKVLHGAFMDMIWLQRDLGLYVVNLFDTFHACKALGYPQKNLAYLLRIFANVDAAKQYQTADWRIRPLPEEMFNYARSDTHYLLYIFDNMRNALVDKSDFSKSEENLIETVMNNSKEVALQKYERSVYDSQKGLGPMGWYNMLCRTPALFDREQFSVFRAVHGWRDQVAREEDEGVQAVMPKHVLYNIAREIPMSMPSLLGCSHPMSKSFQKRKGELLGVIKSAKIGGATGPDMKEFMQEIDPLHGRKNRLSRSAGAQFVENVKKDTELTLQVERIKTALPLRCDNSQFWGASMSTTRFTGPVEGGQSHSLILPLPSLTAEVFERSDHSSQLKANGLKSFPGAQVEYQNIENSQSNQGDGESRKRKALAYSESVETLYSKEVPVGTAPRVDGDVLPDQRSESICQRKKAERKAERKRLKSAKKEEKANDAANATCDDEVSRAFDYTNAPSILHVKQSEADQRARFGSGFNPYAKSINAPKGMRKNRQETAGKAYTFKK